MSQKYVIKLMLDTYTEDTKNNTKRKYHINYIFHDRFHAFFKTQVIKKYFHVSIVL